MGENIKRNPGFEYNSNWLNTAGLDEKEMKNCLLDLSIDDKLDSNEDSKATSLLKIISFIDLTTLNGDDTPDIVSKLSHKAITPLPSELLNKFGKHILHTAAVCVYPVYVKNVADIISDANLTKKIGIASVAAGFPAGLTPLHARLEEIRYAIDQGADEIDVVIDRSLVLTGKWETLYTELKQMKQVCGDRALLKTILSVGELQSLTNIFNASMVAMMAGSDFIKTSTGKEKINATLLAGYVMCRAIKDFQHKTDVKVGLKAAGGISSARASLSWLVLVREILGVEWLNSNLFRIGASSLLGDIENTLSGK